MELTDAAVDYLAVRPALHILLTLHAAWWGGALPASPVQAYSMCHLTPNLVQVQEQFDQAAYTGALGLSASSACAPLWWNTSTAGLLTRPNALCMCGGNF